MGPWDEPACICQKEIAFFYFFLFVPQFLCSEVIPCLKINLCEHLPARMFQWELNYDTTILSSFLSASVLLCRNFARKVICTSRLAICWKNESTVKTFCWVPYLNIAPQEHVCTCPFLVARVFTHRETNSIALDAYPRTTLSEGYLAKN